MSSVIVKDMEMPDSCYHCKIAESCGHYIANYTDRRHPDCPLIALPDKHGRLVDADALEKEGWSLHRTIRVDKNTEEYQTKPLRQVPTIEPQRKKGKWINHRCDDGHHIADCDQCGHSLQWFDDDTPKYCCECGAKMEGEG